MFDKRGTGLTDRVDAAHLPSLETRMDDVRAVMDAAGSGRAALLGASEGAPMAMLFAATYPERTRALVLYGGYAHFHKWVMAPERLERLHRDGRARPGAPAPLCRTSRRAASTTRISPHWWARFERLSASPTAAVALARMNAGDRRARRAAGDPRADAGHPSPRRRAGRPRRRPLSWRRRSRARAWSRSPAATIRSGPATSTAVADAIEEFLTGERAVAEAERVLAALLATRIVRHGADCGDRMWSERSERFQESGGRWSRRHGGTRGGHAGEMMIARFDGPARAIRCAAALREAAQAIGVRERAGRCMSARSKCAGAPVRADARG